MRAESKVRHGRLFVQGILSLAVIGGAAVLLTSGGRMYWTGVLGVVGVLFAFGWWLDHRRERLWQDVCETNFASCLKCAYDLRDHGAHGTCPECGERFVLRETKDRWMNTRGDEGPDGGDTDVPDVYW